MKSFRREFKGIVYYEYRSNAASTNLPLLMIHGHGGDHRGLEKLAQQLPVTVIVPDLPGFGESAELLVPHTIENYVVLLEELMKSVSPKGYNLAGHSLGSAIALSLAKQDKNVQKLILMNPIPEFTKKIKYLIRTMNGIGNKIPANAADALVKARLYALATFLLHSRRRTELAHAKKYLSTQNTARYSFKTWSESGESIFHFDQMEFAKNFSTPALILHGDKDSLITISSISEFSTILGGKLRQFPKAGHFLPLEVVDETADAINRFINT